MGKTRIIPIIEKNPKNPEMTYEQLEEKTAKCMEGRGHLAENVTRWDFLDKNRWTLNTAMGDSSKVIHGSFECSHGGRFLSYLCSKCEGVFRLPFEVEKCIFCDNSEIDTNTNKIRMRDASGRVGVSDSVNPDLYAQAVKDIQENGTQQSNEPAVDIDWKQLEEDL